MSGPNQKLPINVFAFSIFIFFLFVGIAPRLGASTLALSVQSGLISIGPKGNEITRINRIETPEIWYRVSFDQAPKGERIALHCEWYEPDGSLAHKNNYRTRPINHLPWETHARYRLPFNAPLGQWHVTLYRNKVVLQTGYFEVVE